MIFIVFLSIYFFYESYDRQYQHIQKDMKGYKAQINSQYVLKEKVDTLYYYLHVLHTEQVQNNAMLEQYIATQLQEIKNLSTVDSVDNSNTYGVLLPTIDSLLLLKSKLGEIDSQERLALKDLNECMNRFKKVYTALNDDDNRKYKAK